MLFLQNKISKMHRIFRKKFECVIHQTENEFILVPVTDSIVTMNKLYTMNEIGMFIWNRIDGENSVEQIAEFMTAEYDIDKNTALNDTLEFLNKIDQLIEEIK
jgi:hypothetical protein